LTEIGIDIIEIERIRSAINRWGEKFKSKVYLPSAVRYFAATKPSPPLFPFPQSKATLGSEISSKSSRTAFDTFSPAASMSAVTGTLRDSIARFSMLRIWSEFTTGIKSGLGVKKSYRHGGGNRK